MTVFIVRSMSLNNFNSNFLFIISFPLFNFELDNPKFYNYLKQGPRHEFESGGGGKAKKWGAMANLPPVTVARAL